MFLFMHLICYKVIPLIVANFLIKKYKYRVTWSTWNKYTLARNHVQFRVYIYIKR